MKRETATTDLFYYAAIICWFLLAKWLYTFSTNDHLWFLLAPTNAGIELLIASPAIYTVAEGFRHNSLHIIIDRSCSGFNFWLLSFTLLSLSTLHYYKTHKHRLLACGALLVISYGFTVLVNISRITVALFTLKNKAAFAVLNKAWMHEAQGAFIYLLFLVLLHLSIQYITAKLTKTNAYPR